MILFSVSPPVQSSPLVQSSDCRDVIGMMVISLSECTEIMNLALTNILY